MNNAIYYTISTLFIFISCSKDNSDGSSNSISSNNDLNNETSLKDLAWERNKSYETTIKIGQTITWSWGSGRHNLKTTSGVESFDSGYSSTKGFKYSYTFSKVGTTNYVCTPHSDMNGKVIVTE